MLAHTHLLCRNPQFVVGQPAAVSVVVAASRNADGGDAFGSGESLIRGHVRMARRVCAGEHASKRCDLINQEMLTIVERAAHTHACTQLVAWWERLWRCARNRTPVSQPSLANVAQRLNGWCEWLFGMGVTSGVIFNQSKHACHYQCHLWFRFVYALDSWVQIPLTETTLLKHMNT